MRAPDLPAEAWSQVGLMALEAVAVAFLIAGLFRARHRFGLSPLFATLGVFQYLQVILAFSLYVEVLPGASVSPGSVVLFSGSLFGLLLVFLKESPAETKTLVYGILAANLSLSTLSFLLSLHLDSPLVRNPHGLPDGLFRLDLKIMIVGTAVLVLDMLLMILIYPATEHRLRSSFARAALTLCTVLAFDSVVFMTVAFWGEPFFVTALSASIAGKMMAGLIYAGVLAGYMRWIEPSPRAETRVTAAQVLSWRIGQSDGSQAGGARDPELGILPALFFKNVFRQYLRLGEQLNSPVTVLTLLPSGPTESDKDTQLDLMRYLLAVVRRRASPTTTFGRHGSRCLGVVLTNTDEEAGRRAVEGIRAALAEAFEKVRPTPTIESFTVAIGWACTSDVGFDADRLLARAEDSLVTEIDAVNG